MNGFKVEIDDNREAKGGGVFSRQAEDVSPQVSCGRTAGALRQVQVSHQLVTIQAKITNTAQVSTKAI